MPNSKIQLASGVVLLDLTSDTVSPDNLLDGVIAHDKAGNLIVGEYTPPEPPELPAAEDYSF